MQQLVVDRRPHSRLEKALASPGIVPLTSDRAALRRLLPLLEEFIEEPQVDEPCFEHSVPLVVWHAFTEPTVGAKLVKARGMVNKHAHLVFIARSAKSISSASAYRLLLIKDWGTCGARHRGP